MDDRIATLFTDAATPEASALALLREIGFPDPAGAWARLRALACEPPFPDFVKESLSRLVLGLRDTPSPDAALRNFERFFGQVPQSRPLLEYLAARPRAIEILLKLFVRSQYLTETLLRTPVLLDQLTQHRWLADLKSREEFLEAALLAAGTSSQLSDILDGLRRFQRWEILRIGACDCFGLMDLRSATVQLSLLADALVRACLAHVTPQRSASPRGFCIFALGKLGGEELNYSSDIDLVFLAEDNAETWVPVAQQLIRALQTSTGEGFLYRVDMRLRPWGRSGPLVTSAASFLDYLRKHGELWEHQALLKARVVAGDVALGARVLQECDPLLFSHAVEDVRQSVRAAKRRIEDGLARKRREWGEVKSGAGSIRDIEFLTQYLQMVHGRRYPQVRSPNTMEGLVRLADFGFLQADEFRQLTGGYMFLRTIEHVLQLAHNKQIHQLPTEPRELGFLAKRLDYASADDFVAHYDRHCVEIRRIFDRYLGDVPLAPYEPETGVIAPVTAPSPQPKFSKIEAEQHRIWFEPISLTRPMRVVAEPRADNTWRVTVLGIDHPGDLSMICGLLFVYGFDILDGMVTTGLYPELSRRWQPTGATRRGHKASAPTAPHRDFVNAFTVRPPFATAEPEVWLNYEADLMELMLLARTGKQGDAQGRLAKRIAGALDGCETASTPMLPVEVAIDNITSSQATVLQIRGEDTIGFLYELANALALSGINIDAVEIRSDGTRVCDTLWVSDAEHGGKLTDDRRIQQVQAAVVLIKQFTHLLPKSPNAEAALLHFRTFLRDLFAQTNWTEALASLEQPDVLDALAQLLGISDFLWDDFLRLQSTNIFPLLKNLAVLRDAKTAAQLQTELTATLADAANSAERLQRLNDFKDREMFRVDMRHILGRIPAFGQFSGELTDIAETVVIAALEMAWKDLVARHGPPCRADGTEMAWTAAVLGKCGGREMGFASDIEMMFVYEEEGATHGRQPLDAAAFFPKFVERFMHSIRARREGIFHIDLRLRPYGRAGQLAVSLAAFEHYFNMDGPAWPYERQALVKLRPLAGDAAFGQKLAAVRDRLLYIGTPFDFAAVRAMREQQQRKLVKPGTFHAKLSPGGLVDVEYLVQALQITHGHRAPELRHPNTRAAAKALCAAGIITEEDHQRLHEAYIFLRRMIDALRMVRGDARDLTVPELRSEEFEFLARRLNYGSDVSQLLHDLERHSQTVMDLVRRYSPSAAEFTPSPSKP